MSTTKQHNWKYAEKLRNFQSVQALKKLASILVVNPTIFSDRLNSPVYTTNRIPKKKGGWRELLVPEKELNVHSKET
jgi:hypothetical protein